MVSGGGMVLTSLYAGHFPAYSLREAEVLIILFSLFVTARGLQLGGIIPAIARSINKGGAVETKLILITFFLSMLITNDVALVVVLPLTFGLKTARKDLLVISEALAANAGSALTPLGNPQNLFIYWYYGLSPAEFVTAIAPFSLFFLAVLIAFALSVFSGKEKSEEIEERKKIEKRGYVYLFFFVAIILSVLRAVPFFVSVFAVVFALAFDRPALRVDYALLFTFLFFFGLADNLKTILSAEITHTGNVFLFSALSSQIISNVPTALLFSKFTANWRDLLWGTNAGGFGSLFGSFANLIAYKIYLANEKNVSAARFTVKFVLLGYAAFGFSIALYFYLYG